MPLDRGNLSDRRSGGSLSQLQPSIKYFNWSIFREQSRALDRYHRRDFSSLKQRLKDVFGAETADEMIPRPLPLIHRFAVELADQYSREPVRTFSSRSEELSPAQVSSLESWYSTLADQSLWMLSHELLVTQATYIGLILPRSDGQRGFVVSLHRPWECEVTPDPRNPGSLSSAREIKIRVPVSANTDAVQFGILTMRPDTIYIDAGNGRHLPVWTDDLSNPFQGYYPCWYGRLGDPMDGAFWAPLPEDLLAAQEALILAETDIDLIARYQSYGARYITGVEQGMAPEYKIGPNGITLLPKDAELKISQANPTLVQYLSSVNDYLKLVTQLGGINFEGLSKGYTSALARQMSLADRYSLRVRHRSALRSAESRFLRALLLVLRWGGTVLPYPSDTRVDVTFRELEYPADPLATAQAAQTRISLGIESPVDVIMRERSLSREEAEAVYRANLAIAREAQQ